MKLIPRAHVSQRMRDGPRGVGKGGFDGGDDGGVIPIIVGGEVTGPDQGIVFAWSHLDRKLHLAAAHPLAIGAGAIGGADRFRQFPGSVTALVTPRSVVEGDDRGLTAGAFVEAV